MPFPDRPMTYKLRSSNTRLSILYPQTTAEHNSIDVFYPGQSEPDSFSKMDEAARGPIVVFTPGMADKADQLTSVNGKPLSPGETPWNPSSALEPERPGYDELVKPEGAAEPPKHTPETLQVISDIDQDFPNTPRPDMRMSKD